MTLEDLYDYRGQIERCLSRAEEDASSPNSEKYHSSIARVKKHLGAALDFLDLAIKETGETTTEASNDEPTNEEPAQESTPTN